MKKILFTIIFIMNLQQGYSQWISGVLHSFDGSDGATSKGSLTLFGNTLYGRTSAGGTFGKGVIFQLNTDSTDFQVLYNFPDGSSNGLGKVPHHDAMLYYDDNLYGTALEGGLDDNGVIYKISLTGADYSPIHIFNGSDSDGAQPHSGVILVNNVFYGITAEGGTHGNGTLYQINPNGTDFSVLHSFHNSTGDDSHGRLTLGSDGHTLFGMTKTGGSANLGVIFSFDLSGSNYSVIHTFLGGSNDGSSTDHGFVTISNDTIFGMTQSGGASDKGVIFSINEDGSDFNILHSFGSSSNDGKNPFGSLQLSNGFLFGSTREGGDNDQGTIFRINTSGTIYEILFSFDQNSSGEYPIDNVVINDSGTALYCLSQAGGKFDSTGSNQFGTVIKLNKLGSIGIKTLSTEIPSQFNLHQNYPNPFNPETRIKFDILSNAKGQTSNVKLIVYDAAGKEIQTLVDANLSSGAYEVNFNSSNIPTGIYFYKLTSQNFTQTKKMILLK